MSRRAGMLLAAALLAAIGAIGIHARVTWVRTHRLAGANVVVIVIDTLRADHLPFYGYAHDTAPFLGHLARDGVVFARAHSASSWTAPATASIFTSMYPFQHGVTSGIVAAQSQRIKLNRIADDIERLPEVMKRAGYRTFGVADNPNICEAEGFARGFDRFADTSDEGMPVVNARLREWRDEIERGPAPYFLYVHYMDPHAPYAKHDPWYVPSTDEIADLVSAYDSEIRFVDSGLEEMFRLFRWDENTLVIVTSDHGEEFRDHEGLRHGQTLYAEVLDVPLLVYFPARWRPARIDAHAGTIDVLPTLAELAGLPRNDAHEGASLVDALAGGALVPSHRRLYADLVRADRQMTVRSAIQDEWKYIDYQPGSPLLFDLVSDRAEHVNRLADAPDVATGLATTMQGFVATCRKHEQAWSAVTPDQREVDKLKALGYVE